MNRFVAFLEELQDENPTLIECIREGYQIYCESIAELPLYLRALSNNNSQMEEMPAAASQNTANNNYSGQSIEIPATGQYTPNFKVSAGGFIAPLETLRVTSPFGQRLHPVTKQYTMHNGVDFGSNLPGKAAGEPVFAVANGTVTKSGFDDLNGNAIVLQHANGITSSYSHLNNRNVNAGATVNAGDVIGNLGNTGRSTGPHLHFGMRVNGQFVDPMAYIA